MLIAQALLDGLALVSNERLFDAFGVQRVWGSLRCGMTAPEVRPKAGPCQIVAYDGSPGGTGFQRRGWPVLLAAKRSGFRSAVGPAIEGLSHQGYRLSGALVSEVLRLADES